MAGRYLGFDFYNKEFGSGHCDEVFLMFKVHDFPWSTVYSDSDKKTGENLVKLWTNFAKHLNPTPNKSEFNGVTWSR